MTHAGAPPWEWSSTVGDYLRPLVPQYILGVDARKQAPPYNNTAHAPYHWWKARGVTCDTTKGCLARQEKKSGGLSTSCLPETVSEKLGPGEKYGDKCFWASFRVILGVFIVGHSFDCQYCGLPYMANAGHPNDTLFLVFEADFCFCEQDAEAHEERIRCGLSESARAKASGACGVSDGGVASSDGLLPMSSAASSSRVRLISAETALKEQSLGVEEFVQPKAQGKHLAGMNDMSEELKDMMGLMATASRAGCGNVCWCG